MAKFNAPAAWGKDAFDVLTGTDLVDKAELVNKPFLITTVQFKMNDRKVESVLITALDVDGTPFSFSDSSSTGVRAQLAQYLVDSDNAAVIETHEPLVLRLAVMLGLRVSEYDATNERGKTVKAKTYYLRMTPAE